MSEEILWSWGRFSFAATGRLLPLNFLEEEEELMTIGFECEDGAPPLICRNGTAVRRLQLSFPYLKEEILWS